MDKRLELHDSFAHDQVSIAVNVAKERMKGVTSSAYTTKGDHSSDDAEGEEGDDGLKPLAEASKTSRIVDKRGVDVSMCVCVCVCSCVLDAAAC